MGKTFEESTVKNYLLKHGVVVNMEVEKSLESNLREDCLGECNEKHELWEWVDKKKND